MFLPESMVYTVHPFRRDAKVLNFRFLNDKRSGQETVFLEPHSTREPLIVFRVGQLTSVLRCNKTAVWYAGALPQVTRLDLLHRVSQSSNPKPAPLINVWYFHPGIHSIQKSPIKTYIRTVLKKSETVIKRSRWQNQSEFHSLKSRCIMLVILMKLN